MNERKDRCKGHILSANDPSREVGIAWLECKRKGCLLPQDPNAVAEMPYSNPDSWEEARLRAAVQVDLWRNRKCPLKCPLIRNDS